MKFTTANFKNTCYDGNLQVFIATHTGAFKRLELNDENPFAQTDLQQTTNLSNKSRITSLNYGNSEKTEILVGRKNKFVKVYDLNSQEYTSSIEFPDTPIVGLCRSSGKLVAGFGSGNVHIVGERNPTVLIAGNNMSRMRPSNVNENVIATGGKGRQNNLKIFDIECKTKVFTSKNVSNDTLDVEAPVWDTDFAFLDCSRIATCSRYSYVRFYDIRAQRRPIHAFSKFHDLCFSCMIAKDPFVYMGTTRGLMKAFDMRSLKDFVHTYKGFTGTISDLALDNDGKFLVSGCLDRYIRVHDTTRCNVVYQCYIKSKPVRLLAKNSASYVPSFRKERTSENDSIIENKLHKLFVHLSSKRVSNHNQYIEPRKKLKE